MKTLLSHAPKVRTRHPSHDGIKGKLPSFPFRSVIRLGSTTPIADIFPKSVERGSKIVEINTDDSVSVSANKLKMKKAFDDAVIKTAQWWTTDGQGTFQESGNAGNNFASLDKLYPIVAKHIFGSRGTGNHILKDSSQLASFIKGCKDFSKYIFEKYYDYNREYRLHTNKFGCFYTCRKMLKEDTPKEKRWFRNDSNSVWVKDDNPLFDRPSTWDLIVADCVKALDAVGLDFAAFDVRVQSAKHKDKHGTEVVNNKPEWIIIESNSAPSFGEVTTQKYLEMLPKLIEDKSKV